MTAEELARATARLVPLLDTALRESRCAGNDPRGDGVDPRLDLKTLFADRSRPRARNALIAGLGLADDGAVSEAEFNSMVDVAMLRL